MVQEAENTRRRSPRLSPAQGRALVERWRSSGESMAAFSRRHNVRSNVLSYWAAKEEVVSEQGRETGDFFVLTKSAATATPQSHPGASDDPGPHNAIIVLVPLRAGTDVLTQTLRGMLEEAE